jgi:hypothetical protein
MNTTKRGDISTARILAKFVELGYQVLLPWGSAPYDLALEVQDKIIRVECKTGRLRKGCVVFNTVSNLYGGRGVGYTGKADLFAVFCPDTDAIYVVPVREAPQGKEMALRVEQPVKTHPAIQWAQKYELLEKLRFGPVV